MGKKSLAGGTCGSGNFTLSPRYKVCLIETEGFCFYSFFILLFFLKRLQLDTDVLSQKKKRKKKKKKNQQ